MDFWINSVKYYRNSSLSEDDILIELEKFNEFCIYIWPKYQQAALYQ